MSDPPTTQRHDMERYSPNVLLMSEKQIPSLLQGVDLACRDTFRPSQYAVSVKRIKNINPRVPVIAGGITASLFAKQFIEHLGFDFVIRGDAEIPLPRLVSSLLDGEGQIEDVDNLVGKNGLETPWNYHLTQLDVVDLSVDSALSRLSNAMQGMRRRKEPAAIVISPEYGSAFSREVGSRYHKTRR